MTNKEHEIFMRKLFDDKLDEAFDRGCVNIVKNLTEYFTKYGITLNVNNWMNDYTQGYDTAKDDIGEFCANKKFVYSDRPSSAWNSGYISALIDVIEHIERM